MCGVDMMFFPGRTPLIFASRNDKLPVVEHLIEHKANIEAKSDSIYLFIYLFISTQRSNVRNNG